MKLNLNLQTGTQLILLSKVVNLEANRQNDLLIIMIGPSGGIKTVYHLKLWNFSCLGVSMVEVMNTTSEWG
jgi:hypothetical protein